MDVRDVGIVHQRLKRPEAEQEVHRLLGDSLLVRSGDGRWSTERVGSVLEEVASFAKGQVDFVLLGACSA
jgi:hypothetical protein